MIAAANAPDSHATSGQHIDTKCAIVDLDDVDAFGPPTAASFHMYLPIRDAAAPFNDGAVGDDESIGVD
jgi:hypothetical protein